MKNAQGFTLVELIVVVTILSILSAVWFVAYSDNIIIARDSARVNDAEKLFIDLKTHKQKEGAYPLPVDPINITNSWTVVYQGLLTNAIASNVLANIPKDPRSNNWYWYSTTSSRQQFQLGLTRENWGSPMALVRGDYKSVAKNLFPTLLLAVSWNTSFLVTANMSKFILNNGTYNLPYDMTGNIKASGQDFTTISQEAWVNIETGGSYASCQEIYEAGRSMWSGTYQIINSSWSLSDTPTPCFM